MIFCGIEILKLRRIWIFAEYIPKTIWKRKVLGMQYVLFWADLFCGSVNAAVAAVLACRLPPTAI
ncbi:MAG TPA: hypothetical protein DEQ84_01905 [Prevotellaceae bacterium]|nr:hypothetical protein [Prevotellaceae bacterium]